MKLKTVGDLKHELANHEDSLPVLVRCYRSADKDAVLLGSVYEIENGPTNALVIDQYDFDGPQEGDSGYKERYG